MSDEKIEEQAIDLDWLDKEVEEIKENKFDGEVLPSLVLEENKVTEIEIDFSKPFDMWTSPEGTIKKIIPVMHKGEKKNFWINTKNPCYSEIVMGGKNGETKFKIMRTGQKQNTRYTLVKE